MRCSWLLPVSVVAACTSVVRPPADPAPVFLLAEAMHRGLVLPDAHGDHVEYGFGDFGWFALGDDAFHEAFLHNCADTVADWLRELGCEVTWVPVRIDPRIDRAAGAGR